MDIFGQIGTKLEPSPDLSRTSACTEQGDIMAKHLARILTALLFLVPIAGAAAAAETQLEEGDLEAFVTRLSGDAVNPPVSTRAGGIASFRHTVGDADAPCEDEFACPRDIHYTVSVFSLFGREVTARHIHLGAVGENGPVIVNLPTSRGTFTVDDFVGPLAGADKEDLIELMRTGGVYVDVHTERFPDGEVRGQIHGRRGEG